MLSRRDKLLILPWQQRRFENHRRKVQTAMPAIDASPPVSREHVLYKKKKLQNESERSLQIEKENLLLLRKMGYIMRTSRVDNYWITPPPNFLNRVNLYQCKSEDRDEVYSSKPTVLLTPISCQTRKSKCVACTPQEFINIEVPEERIPWEPPKPAISTRLRSKSLPSRPPSMLTPLIEQSVSKKSQQTKTPEKRTKSSKSRKSYHLQSASDFVQEDGVQSLVLSRGALKLYVNFPSDTNVKLQDGTVEKIITRGSCQCKNSTKRFS